MIPEVVPISVNGAAYLAMAGGLVLLAWSRWRRWFLPALALAGLVMAVSWLGPADLMALFVFLAVPYFVAKSLWGRGDRDRWVGVSLVITVQVLLFLIIKRYTWFDFLGALDHPVAVIGISYILFRQIHLIIDAPYNAEYPFSLLRYIAYALNPWTLVAGPIQRYQDFCDGLSSIGRPDNRAALDSAHRIVSGLIKAFVIAPLFLEPSAVGPLSAANANWIDFVIVLYGFPIYLYLNFSGYTDVMIGGARLCGVTTMPENFNHPYIARNVRDFWNRWHMSFGSWVKDYVFTPLSTRLLKATAAVWHNYLLAITVLFTFYIVGAWHGTTLNFVIFGLIQGVGVLVSAVFDSSVKNMLGRQRYKIFNQNKFIHGISILITLHFTCFSIMLLNGTVAEVSQAITAFFF